MKINKIAVLAHNDGPEFLERHKRRIEEVFPRVEVLVAYEEDELMQKTTDADVLLTWPSKKIEKFCTSAPSLKWIHAFTTGVDGILKQSKVREMDIKLSSTKGIHGYPISDHVLADIYLFLRAYHLFFKSQVKKEWYREPRKVMDEAAGKTVGIIGLGNIGMEIARKCKLLDMKVVATKNTPIQHEWVDQCYSPAQLDELLKESDFVVVVCPLTNATANMIGERELRLMKKSAVLINVARGGIVDQDALLKVLNDKSIAGAALDALDPEPLPSENPLWEAPNVLITPHMAAQSPYYMDRAVEIIIDNLLRFSNGKPLLHEIDKVLGY